MNKITRLLSGIIASTIIFSVGCSQNDNPSNEPDNAAVTTTPEVSETQPLDPLEARKLVSDDLPEMDYEGAEFRISVTDKFAYEMNVDAENGDIINDVVYTRNRLIEDRFNITIKNIVVDMMASDNHSAHPNFIMNSVMAGDDNFELAGLYIYTSERPILSGCYLNWNDIKYVDFDKPWWIKGAENAFTIGGKMYIAGGDLSVTTLVMSYVYLFNKKLAENYGIDNLYGVVSDGKWTLDYLATVSKDIYEDINGNNTADQEDRYGAVLGTVTDLDAYLPAFDQPIIAFTSGTPVCVINTEKSIQAVEKMYDLYYNNPGAYVEKTYDNRYKEFSADLALFTPSRLNYIYEVLRDMESDFGIIPFPKWDDAQERYYTNTLDNWSALGIPVTVKDPDFVGLIVEALTAESYKTVIPAYYDVALKVKFTRDEDSVKMLDIITEGRTYDFSILHSTDLKRLPYLFRDLISGKNSDFVSKYASIETAVNDGLQRLIDAYAAI
jgi:hypothetical protein